MSTDEEDREHALKRYDSDRIVHLDLTLNEVAYIIASLHLTIDQKQKGMEGHPHRPDVCDCVKTVVELEAVLAKMNQEAFETIEV